ncbi:hypothetical protein BDV97DRAFT_373369 [Delphinella strobiligena]|nr:hypothetical protein BDV97DRAFT_373369 [Delphinella strobiligena]
MPRSCSLAAAISQSSPGKESSPENAQAKFETKFQWRCKTCSGVIDIHQTVCWVSFYCSQYMYIDMVEPVDITRAKISLLVQLYDTVDRIVEGVNLTSRFDDDFEDVQTPDGARGTRSSSRASRIAEYRRTNSAPRQPLLETKVSIEHKCPDFEVFPAPVDITNQSEVEAAFADLLRNVKVDVLVSGAAMTGPWSH